MTIVRVGNYTNKEIKKAIFSVYLNFFRFVEYVFISSNSWFLGKLKTVKTTLMILPRSLIRQIEEQGKKLEVFTEKNTPLVFESFFADWNH